MSGGFPPPDNKRPRSGDNCASGAWGGGSGWSGAPAHEGRRGSDGPLIQHVPPGAAVTRGSGWGGGRAPDAGGTTSGSCGTAGWGAAASHQTHSGPNRGAGWGGALSGAQQQVRSGDAGAVRSGAALDRGGLAGWGAATHPYSEEATSRGSGWGGAAKQRSRSEQSEHDVVSTQPAPAVGRGDQGGWGAGPHQSHPARTDAEVMFSGTAQQALHDATLSARLFRQVCQERAVDDPVRAAELPIVAHKQTILSLVEHNQVIIVTGETGSGKTTQVPQFILSRWPESSMIVTQPRRIAATSIAKRVANEMHAGRVGGLVGYQIGMKSELSVSTRMLFCTTGILLRRLVTNKEKSASEFTHIILDEMHEMDMDMAFVLVVLKRLLQQYPKLKLILMSATADASKMAAYFAPDVVSMTPARRVVSRSTGSSWRPEPGNRAWGENPKASGWGGGWGGAGGQSSGCESVHEKVSVGWGGANSASESNGHLSRPLSRHERPVPIVNVSGRLFPVETVWVEEAFELLNPESKGFKPSALELTPNAYSAMVGGCQWEFNPSRPRVSDELVDLICRLILCIDRHDRDECCVGPGTSGAHFKAVLVFMPGFGEIQALMRALSEWCGHGRPFVAVPLHSQVAREEQQQAFDTFPNQRKIIISTNIAESSLTVPDVRYVIDAGLSKERCFDQISQLESLQTILASKASAKQRQGRAGRVGPGLCFRMYPREWWDRGEIPDQGVSELQRSPLERLILQTLVLELGEEPEPFLLSAMDPPEVDAVRSAIERLTEVGAVEATAEQRLARRCGRLTELGRVCSELPLDTHLTRLVLLGRGFGVMHSAIELAACISNTRLFRKPPPGRPQEEVACFSSRLQWSGGTCSDALAARRAYVAWKTLGARNDDRWAREHRVDIGALREIDDLVKDCHQRLEKLLQPHSSPAARAFLPELPMDEQEELLQLALVGACYPRLFVGKAPKYLSVDSEARPPTQTNAVTRISSVVEVIGAPADATEATIGELMSQAGQCSLERMFQSREISHWRVAFEEERSWLSVPLALKIGDSNVDNGRSRRGGGDWRLGAGSVGHQCRAVFVPASDRRKNPVSIDRESIGGTVVQPSSDAVENLVLCAAFVAATPGRVSGAGNVGGGITLRCCSVMPSTWDEPLPLLVMLFAPMLSVRTDRRCTRILGVEAPGAVEAVALKSVVGLADVHTVNCFRAAITTALSDPASVPVGPATADLGHRLIVLLRSTRPTAKPRLPFGDHPQWNVSAQTVGECSAAVLPSMGSCGLVEHQQPADDDSDEEACAGRQKEVDRLWASAASGGGRGRENWCVCCRRSVKGNLLKHLRTEQHKRAEEYFVRGASDGRR